jgi:hypothetical protein
MLGRLLGRAHQTCSCLHGNVHSQSSVLVVQDMEHHHPSPCHVSADAGWSLPLPVGNGGPPCAQLFSVTLSFLLSCCQHYLFSLQGGPSLFQSEMEGLLALSKAGATTWSFGPGEGGSVLWALAHARHYTPRLADIERGLVQVGGTGASATARWANTSQSCLLVTCRTSACHW